MGFRIVVIERKLLQLLRCNQCQIKAEVLLITPNEVTIDKEVMFLVALVCLLSQSMSRIMVIYWIDFNEISRNGGLLYKKELIAFWW